MLLGRDKELGFRPDYGRTHEVNEIPHVNIRTVPATCVCWGPINISSRCHCLLRVALYWSVHSPGRWSTYPSWLSMVAFSSRVINDPRRSYSSKNHGEMAGGKKHLETESQRHSSSPTTRGPIKSVRGLKVRSFRYRRLRAISFIPTLSTIPASQVEIKRGPGERGTLRNLHGVGRQGSRVPTLPAGVSHSVKPHYRWPAIPQAQTTCVTLSSPRGIQGQSPQTSSPVDSIVGLPQPRKLIR